jgi:mannose-6-phosphate isomerase-like protein (cupin superfamily)
MRIKEAVFVYRMIGGSKLALHGRHHTHEKEHEIHLFLEGNGTLLLNQSRCTIEGNHLFMVWPGEPHSILPQEVKSPISYYAVLFEPELPPDVEILSLMGGGGGGKKKHLPRGGGRAF